MDNETKLTKQQLMQLLSRLKSASKDESVSVDDFVKENLSGEQAEKLRRAMQNPQLISSLTSSPAVKKFMERLKGGDGANGS